MADRHVIIPAGGSGSRMGLPYPKQLLPLGDRTLIERVLDLFAGERVTVAVPADHLALFQHKIGERARLVIGGATRFDSVRRAFESLPDPGADDLVLIHDAARPYLEQASLAAAWQMAAERGAVIYAAPAVDTIKVVDPDGRIQATLDRETIYHAQTPQIFRYALLARAYQLAASADFTDEAGLVEASGTPVHVFRASHGNRKLTHREDLNMAAISNMRIGHGYDVHRYDDTRPLYLCGVHIEAGPGLLGHSDADVALHALIDALLGAAGLGDIGHWFPDNDPSLKGIRSTLLLERVWRDLTDRGYSFINADLTIQAQVPKLAPHIQSMRERVAGLLGCEPARVNVKATTTEGLGFVGRREGMAASASVLLAAPG